MTLKLQKKQGCVAAWFLTGHCSEERLKATGVPVFRNLTELFENYKDF